MYDEANIRFINSHAEGWKKAIFIKLLLLKFIKYRTM